MDIYLGQIVIFPFNFTPTGFALCNGALLTIRDNAALYSLFGPKFGGDGTTTFALPDYTSISPEGSAYYMATQGMFPQR
jgi:microcystin-dependent protein